MKKNRKHFLTQHPGDEGRGVTVPGDTGDGLHLALGDSQDALVPDSDLPALEEDLRGGNWGQKQINCDTLRGLSSLHACLTDQPTSYLVRV